MLVGLRSGDVRSNMVTLITEKLQNQSLDDLSCKTYNINLRSSEKLNNGGSLFPYEINEDRPWKMIDKTCPITELNKNSIFPFSMCPFSADTPTSLTLPWQNESSNQSLVSGWLSKLNLNDSFGQLLAPPTKRHCRSLSEPDELSRCRSPWKPGNSKVWTPVSKRRCNSGGSATLQRCNSHGSATLQRSTSNVPSLNNVFTVPTCNTSPLPRPSSASSGFVDSSEGSTTSSIRWNSGGPCDFNLRRRLSLSQEHITKPGDVLPSANSTPTSTPELRRRQGLLRCRSQPCVLNERKTRLKRRRDEDVRWSRPSIDFFKMTRTSKSLGSLDYEDDDDDEDSRLKTIVSSPCDSNDLMNIVTPGSSPVKETVDKTTYSRFKTEGAVSESEEDLSDCEYSDGVMASRECADLDVEQIENN
ncbi:protein FAM53A [Gastrophryne carolinensis]